MSLTGVGALSWFAIAISLRASRTGRRTVWTPVWLASIQKYLPQPDVTVLLDIPPEVSARRKQRDRDRYERDLALLARVRDSYLRQATSEGWVRLDADRDRAVVAADVYAAVAQCLEVDAS